MTLSRDEGYLTLFSQVPIVSPDLADVKRIVEKIITTIDEVSNSVSFHLQHHRHQCDYLLQRCSHLFIEINKICLVDNDQERKASIKQLEAAFDKIRNLVDHLSVIPTLSCYLQRRETADIIHDSHVFLDDSLRRFKDITQSDLLFNAHQRDVAYQRDEDQFIETLAELSKNVDHIKEAEDHVSDAIYGLLNECNRPDTNPQQHRFNHAILEKLRKRHIDASWEVKPGVISSCQVSKIECEPLGEGGFGAVFSGRWNRVRVAFKALKKGTPLQALTEEFSREFEIWRDLEHEHIAFFLGACTASDPPLIVSVLYQFGDVVKYLDRFPNANRIKLSHEISLGMSFLHDKKIIHGDLKPANILIDDGHHARVADFGLSKVKQSVTASLTTVVSGDKPHGTRSFMAPELFLQHKIGYPSDVYAFAISLYQMMTGNIPFQNWDAEMYLELVVKKGKRLQKPAKNHPSISLGLSEPLWQLIEDCWSPQRHKRPRFKDIEKKLLLLQKKAPNEVLRVFRFDTQEVRPTFASSNLAQTITDVLKKIKQVGTVLTQVHRYAKFAWIVLSETQKIVVTDDRIHSLWARVTEILDLVLRNEEVKEKPMFKKTMFKKTVEIVLQQIYEFVLFLRWYDRKGSGIQLIPDALFSKADHAIEKFCEAFDRLWKYLRDGMLTDQVKRAYRFLTVTEQVVDIAGDERLDRLPGAMLSAVEYEHKGCLPGTRVKLLDDIIRWLHTSGDERILLLSGPAGTGKSSVANTIAELMESLGRLAASFRFDRSDACRTPDVLIGNLCRQLSRFDEVLKSKFLEAMKRHGTNMSCIAQAKKLLVEPILNDVDIVGPIVVIIDALDESGNDDVVTHGTSRVDLVRTIVTELTRLPPSIKFLITSREEGWITPLMSRCGSCKHMRITDTPGTEEDIKRYVERRMDDIRCYHRRPETWPTTQQIQHLTHYCGSLFISADVVCSFIEGGPGTNPDARIREVLDPSRRAESGAESRLDALYRTVFERSLQHLRAGTLDSNRGAETKNWWQVVGTIVALRTPLTAANMDALLGLPTDSLETTRDIIFSVLPVLKVDLKLENKVELLHKSVFDFLTTRAPGEIRISVPSQNRALAIHCLAYMNHNLESDMEWLSASQTRSGSAPDDPKIRDTERNTETLRYACRHFARHLVDSDSSLDHLNSTSLIQEIHTFLTCHILHWLEVMARLDEMYSAEESFKLMKGWMQDGMASLISNSKRDDSQSDTWMDIISDGLLFMRNSRHVVTVSPMEIYYSALAMSPETSHTYKLYSTSTQPLPKVTSSRPLWTRSICVFEGHRDQVNSVTFSPDGKTIASASDDWTVRLWDAEKGAAIGSALEGHSDWVISITFSPDGKAIASASHDGTVRLWDIEKGEAIGSVLEGHGDWVISVTFSPDGKTIASASDDGTVHLWDVEKGEAIGPGLEGYSVTFSPDGKTIASASHDGTVRLWDIEKGEAIGFVLEGHGDWVISVTFSPDGKTMACASDDGTVRLLDVEKGEAIGPALQGHSVTFSPGWKIIASASHDGTLHLWDIKKKEAIGSALEGHCDRVNSMAFSPDGKTIASASDDGTVRLWDVEKGETIGSALEGHSDRVTSVAFSPDGKTVASASRDGTVRLWDVEKGEAIGSDLEGHSDCVISFTCSPNGKTIASASLDGTMRLWDVEKGEAIGSALEGHSVTFSPDGKTIALASRSGTVRLWDVEKWEAIGFALEGHSVTFSLDGKTVSCDGAILWDVEKENGPNFVDHSCASDISRDHSVQPELLGHIDATGFLVNHNSQPLIWIPAHLRDTRIATIYPSTYTAVIGGISGAVTIIRNLERVQISNR